MPSQSKPVDLPTESGFEREIQNCYFLLQRNVPKIKLHGYRRLLPNEKKLFPEVFKNILSIYYLGDTIY